MSTVPSIPLILIRPKCRDQTITIFWNPPATDGGSPIQTYGVGLYDTGGGGIFFDSVIASIFSYTFTGLTNGQTYAARVLARNAIGDSEEAIYRFVQPGNKPSIPQNGTSTFVRNDTINITWDAPSSNGGADIGWYVGKAISNNPSDLLIKYSAYSTDRSLTFYSLNPASSYTFNLYAVNDPGYSIPLTIGPTQSDLLVSFTASTYSGSGAWTDDSPNGRDATIETGTAAKNTKGNGIVLDGSTGWRFDPIGSHNAWTVLTWFKRTGPSSSSGCLVTEVFTGGSINILLLSSDAGVSSTQLAGGFFDGSFEIGAPQTFPLNEWHSMVVTWDGSDIKTYIDGSLVDTTNYSDNTSSSSDNNYYRIGRRWDNADYVQGEVGELILRSRALSAPEVTNHVSATYETYALVDTATLDTLTTESTNFSSSWTIDYPHAVTVRYYSTNSSTVPAYPGGTLVGTAQSVSAGTTTNTLSPSVTPTAGTYYFVGVTSTATGSAEVRSSTALLMPF
uniref:Fibronectin type-III domain-containing protein n=1 Tax=viral metagenome TaxID=1070528 RepID=A0A6C0DNB8_9ZZZZ